MSTFSQFVGGGGGGATIKAIQRGVISIAAGAASGTATITSVDTAKSELRFLGGSGYDVSGTVATVPRVVLTNATTVTATVINANATGGLSASWELTEWN